MTPSDRPIDGFRPLRLTLDISVRQARRGFTLIELMIVLAVAAILAAVAFPAYKGQVAKGRRADAKQALLDLSQKLERYYTERGSYAGATLGNGGIYPAQSSGGYYTLAITRQTADGFAVTATPRGVQAGDDCGALGYNHQGDRSVAAGASLPLDQCW